MIENLEWPSLQYRGKVAGLAMLYKNLRGKAMIDRSNLTPGPSRKRRGHCRKTQTDAMPYHVMTGVLLPSLPLRTGMTCQKTQGQQALQELGVKTARNKTQTQTQILFLLFFFLFWLFLFLFSFLFRCCLFLPTP